MNGEETYRDTLRYALALAGSERELAGQLNVPVRQLQDWLNGNGDIPDRTFHAALDLVIGSSRQAIFRARTSLQRFR